MKIKSALDLCTNEGLELVEQLIYSEITELMTNESYFNGNPDDLAIYKVNFPDVYDSVIQSQYEMAHNI